jgi:hypothetical protein
LKHASTFKASCRIENNVFEFATSNGPLLCNCVDAIDVE